MPRPAQHADGAIPTSSSRSRTTAAPSCASAMTRNGLRPQSGTAFTATYRVGNGRAGNVGADALRHIVSARATRLIAAVRNPLPARGGIEPETQRGRPAEGARRVPHPGARGHARGLRRSRRAAGGHPARRRDFRWTGSWHTVFVTRRPGRRPTLTPEFETRPCVRHLEPYRMAGHDLEIDDPRFVAARARPARLRAARLLPRRREAGAAGGVSNRRLPDGRRGLFHPDNSPSARRST